MLTKLRDIYYNRFYIELVVATMLFIVAVATHEMVTIIIYMLYFIIMLEMVRAVSSYLKEKRIKIRILIDASIILALRELIVNVVKINKENLTSMDALLSNSINYHVMIFAGVLLFLLFIRYLAMLTSPDKKSNR